MLADLRIQNYRLFDDLTIKGLRRINLFIGKNNSGKSTVLEAVALLAGGYSPEILFRLNWEHAAEMPKDEYAFQRYVRCFFRDLDSSAELVVSASDMNRRTFWVRVSVKRRPTKTVSASQVGTEAIAGMRHETLVFRQEGECGGHVESRASLVKDGIAFETQESTRPPPPPPYIVQYVSANVDLRGSEVEFLSGLRREKRADVILDVLRCIEPRVRDVPEVLVDNGAPNVYCDIGVDRLVPLGLMGRGLVRTLRLALIMERASLFSEEGKLVMIDEAENGIHHEAMVDHWKAIDEAARRRNIQVFATTHSYECLQSASEAVADGGLAVHRLEIDDDRRARCVTMDPEAVEATMRHGFEVR